MAITTWNPSQNPPEQALELPEGSYAADFGFLVEQSVSPDQTLEAAQALTKAGLNTIAASQAKVIVLAQENGLAFQDWTPLKTI